MSDTEFFRASSSGCSDTGRVRKVNEDAWLSRPEIGLWAVADGMGGHAAGGVASQMVIDALRLIPKPSTLGTFVQEVCQELQLVNEKLREEGARRGGVLVGTTVAVLLAYQRHCAYLWAGDSRIYLYRDGRLQQLTRDHTRVEDLVAEGILRREEMAGHPEANVVTRAIAGIEGLEFDSRVEEIRDGDIYLLCTDGLNKEVDDAEIAELLASTDTVEASRALLDLAVRRGGRDNVTVVAVQFSRPFPFTDP